MENKKRTSLNRIFGRHAIRNLGLTSLIAGAVVGAIASCDRNQDYHQEQMPQEPSSQYSAYTNYVEHVVQKGENPSELIQKYTGLPAREIYIPETRNTWIQDNGLSWNEVSVGQKVKIRTQDN